MWQEDMQLVSAGYPQKMWILKKGERGDDKPEVAFIRWQRLELAFALRGQWEGKVDKNMGHY